ncbi:hypothetical protein BDP27DRAFT_1378500 [Rhodocollybia butyracea]|uniref:Myb/SANT-like domain-containing protein n=1 Tax=Rhodocollybia butyracea TaxID=206335 RepID=A0A9P5TVE9_9AGAR|nr:hypothetical protein BDP27DRAFT_1378500 [Rhodocollybia butyracea]
MEASIVMLIRLLRWLFVTQPLQVPRKRVIHLKKEYREVKSIREKSGFGWDSARGVATATPAVWAALIKLIEVLQSKPGLAKWQKRSFPLYDQIQELINGQVATGATAFFPGDPFPPLGTTSTNSNGIDEMDGGEIEEEEEESPTDDNEMSPFTTAQTPGRQPLMPTSSLNSITPVMRKRQVATADTNERKRAHGRKPTQSDAGFEMAEAVRDLARSAMGETTDPSVLSPARKKRAITLLEKDDELSDNEMIDAFKLIRRDTSVADMYIAIGSVKRRTCFIQAELMSAQGDTF